MAERPALGKCVVRRDVKNPINVAQSQLARRNTNLTYFLLTAGIGISCWHHTWDGHQSQQCTSSLTLSTSLYEGLISKPMPAALGVPKMSPIQVLSWTYFCVHTGEEYPTWHGHWLQFPFLVLFFNLSLFHPMQHNLASIFLLSEHTVRDAPPWGTWLRTLRHWWRKAENSPAPDRIQTHNVQIMWRVLYRSATTAALPSRFVQ